MRCGAKSVISESETCDEPISTQKDNEFSEAFRNRCQHFAEQEAKGYAMLRALDKEMNSIALHADVYYFGRNPSGKHFCDFRELSADKGIWKAISSRHFHIERDFVAEKTYLHDTSSYGTFINKIIVEKGNRKQLHNGDLISIADPEFLVFVYEEGDKEDDDFPYCLTSRYFIARTLIGEGAMGKVFMGRCRKNVTKSVAVKVISKTRLSFTEEGESAGSRAFGDVKNEVKVMLKVSHPNCVQLEYVYESPKMLYLVMEYVGGGELFDVIKRSSDMGKGLPEKLTKFYCWQLINALHYLHSNNIVHRDVKPENVLLVTDEMYSVVKLSDFGLSKITCNYMETFCGTRCYMAPELWSDLPQYCSKVDIWSLGALIFVCLNGRPAFNANHSDMQLQNQIKRGNLILTHSWKTLSMEARNFIELMLRVDPIERPSAKDLTENIWLDDPIVRQADACVAKYLADCGR